MIHLSTAAADPASVRADATAYFCYEDGLHEQLDALGRRISAMPAHVRRGVFRARESETLLLVPRGMKTQHLLLVGLGTRSGLTLEKLRRGAAAAVKAAGQLKARSLAIAFPALPSPSVAAWETDRQITSAAASAIAEGAALASYRFRQYVSTANDTPALRRAVIIARRDHNAVRAGVSRARIVCEAACLARDLSNEPGNVLYPDSLARRARKAGKHAGFRVRVLGETDIRALKMGGVLGVAQGSAHPPRLLLLEHRPPSRTAGTVVLVGKGVTFDSGGISIKPSAGMAEMKMDMSGAAAVIGTLAAAAQLRLPVRLVGIIPAVENLPGGNAMRPGDILRHFNGLTSEVDNTDAEGRLILADALAYAARYAPDLVVDLATLTGAVVVALGHVATGMLGNDQPTMDALAAAGYRTYERVWQLPLFEEYARLIKSEIADVKNTGGRWAGAITAAMFLKRFVGDHRWVHLDIAGTAGMEESAEYVQKGGSGVGVRLLIDFLSRWKRPPARRGHHAE